MRYHEKFGNFHRRTIEATAAFFESKPFRGTDVEKTEKFKQWLSDVSRIYSIPVPTLVIGSECGSGLYNRLTQTIELPKHSVVSLLHEFRHHMQAQGLTRVRLDQTLYERFTGESPVEHDARGWSLSLFYKVKPRLFEKSVRSGKIFFVEPTDLEPTHTS